MTNQHTSRSWADERIERLELLWKTTCLTAGQIASEFGITRNAVIGKLHRLGLSMADRPSREDRSFEEQLRQHRAQVLREERKLERHAVKLTLQRQRRADARAEKKCLQDSHNESQIHLNESPLPQPHSGQRPLLSLAKGECRWPSGHGTIAEPFAFCGSWQTEGSSYCVRHQRLSRRRSGEYEASPEIRARGAEYWKNRFNSKKVIIGASE